MGLLIDNNGIPVTYELFPGNTMDQHTLTDSVNQLKALYGMEKITVVADRGLNSGSNLVYLCPQGYGFVISYTLKKSKDEFKELVFDDTGWEYRYDPNSGEETNIWLLTLIQKTAGLMSRRCRKPNGMTDTMQSLPMKWI